MTSIVNKIPDVNICCGCVTDLKTAAAIIAVLGIVTSPTLSWAVVRHAYVIRVSCIVTTSSARSDVVDINLNNILSFGFGANAGLGPSCLSRNTTSADSLRSTIEPTNPRVVDAVKFLGWIVLAADILFLMSSINFLIKIFKGRDKRAAKMFIITGLLSVILSCIYGMLFVTACVLLGGAFPIFEFFFTLVDLMLWTTWLHFIAVVNTYLRKSGVVQRGIIYAYISYFYNTIYQYFSNVNTTFFGRKSSNQGNQ